MIAHDAVFKNFERCEITADGEHIYDFLGLATAVRFKKSWAKFAPPAGSKFKPNLPVVNEHYLDWVALLESVLRAGDVFRIVELGAGWGTWSSSGLAACKQVSHIMRTEVVAIEADGAHYEWMCEHFAKNNIMHDGVHLVHGAVGVESGLVEFPVIENPDEDYGGSLRQVDTSKNTVAVKQYTLEDLLSMVAGPVDFLHIDIQGEEYNILPDAMDILRSRVKSILIGTHISSEGHSYIVSLFESHGWEIRMDYERGKLCNTPYGDIQLGDGVIVANNPPLY